MCWSKLMTPKYEMPDLNHIIRVFNTYYSSWEISNFIPKIREEENRRTWRQLFRSGQRLVICGRSYWEHNTILDWFDFEEHSCCFATRTVFCFVQVTRTTSRIRRVIPWRYSVGIRFRHSTDIFSLLDNQQTVSARIEWDSSCHFNRLCKFDSHLPFWDSFYVVPACFVPARLSYLIFCRKYHC